MASEIDEPIHITNYNPHWPLFFEKEKALLQKIFGNVPIEHFGSTSIPGLKAKPIIDILVGIPGLYSMQNYTEALAALGYTGFGEAGVPGRLYFTKRLPGIGYNLAVTTYNSDLWKDNIAVRNYLRTHPEEASAYVKLKEAIYGAGATTLLEYSQRKNDFLQRLLETARNWAQF